MNQSLLSLNDRDFSGLDLVMTAVIVTDEKGIVQYVNSAAQSLFDAPSRYFLGQTIEKLFENGNSLKLLVKEATSHSFSHKRTDLRLHRLGYELLSLQCTVSTAQLPGAPVVLEFQEIDQQLRVSREERLSHQYHTHKELLRNLAHEIKNPLGGIRGAAQLLEPELPNAELKEFTGVIIKEARRLELLVDRLLAPYRAAHIVGDVNIHEVLEHVRSILIVQYPQDLQILRDYDISVPEFRGDKAHLIQAVLNIAQNAAEALHGQTHPTPCITFKTRVLRQATVQKQRYRLVLLVHIMDNGPGVLPEIAEQIFFPLVSGKQGGTGLGLTLAQTFIEQHFGTIAFESKAGFTNFQLIIPLP